MKKLTKEECEEQGIINDPTDDVVFMTGPYPYTKDEVEAHVENIEARGNYRTGVLNEKGAFIPKYAGRGVVYDRLRKHLDEGFEDTHFKFRYEGDEIRSYEIESADYHYFKKQLRNDIHPRKPDGMDAEITCPYCGS